MKLKHVIILLLFTVQLNAQNKKNSHALIEEHTNSIINTYTLLFGNADSEMNWTTKIDSLNVQYEINEIEDVEYETNKVHKYEKNVSPKVPELTFQMPMLKWLMKDKEYQGDSADYIELFIYLDIVMNDSNENAKRVVITRYIKPHIFCHACEGEYGGYIFQPEGNDWKLCYSNHHLFSFGNWGKFATVLVDTIHRPGMIRFYVNETFNGQTSPYNEKTIWFSIINDSLKEVFNSYLDYGNETYSEGLFPRCNDSISVIEAKDSNDTFEIGSAIKTHIVFEEKNKLFPDFIIKSKGTDWNYDFFVNDLWLPPINVDDSLYYEFNGKNYSPNTKKFNKNIESPSFDQQLWAARADKLSFLDLLKKYYPNIDSTRLEEYYKSAALKPCFIDLYYDFASSSASDFGKPGMNDKYNNLIINYLELSIKAGFNDHERITNDTNFNYFRSEPEFKALMEKHFPNKSK